MKRLLQVGLLLAAVGVNVALAAANLSAATAGRNCPSGWRACQCYVDGDPESCCAVCAESCNGCKVQPTPPQPEDEPRNP